MTRINTNVSSAIAQSNLARSQASLQTALQRLSTGLRINVGKDDPAGLIASEVLRADIVSTQRGITNSQRANQMIATADSALGQVSSLLNDIRGLVSDAANTGALSEEQIAANQLQIDSSLEAIDRIAQVTQFQGKRLLDGNLDFVTQDVDATKMNDLKIETANFGTQTEINVGVEVVAQAMQASLKFKGTQVSQATVLEVGGASGFEAFSFDAGSTITEMRDAINLVSDVLGVQAQLGDRTADEATKGVVRTLNAGGANGLAITAKEAGSTAGNFTIRYSLGAANDAKWSAGDPNIIDVTLQETTWATYKSDLQTNAAGTGFISALGGGADTWQLESNVAGSQFNGIKIVVDSVAAAGDSATYDYETNTITASLSAATDVAFKAAIGTLSDLFTLSYTTTAATDVFQAGEITLTHVSGANGAQAGADGGQVHANATYANIKTQLEAVVLDSDPGNYVTVAAVGDTSKKVDLVTVSGMIGSVNATDDSSAVDDPDNLIQLSGTDYAKNLPIQFVANGANQSFAIDYQLNERTSGYSTAYLSSSAAGASAVLKVAYTGEQGQQHDGIKIQLIDSNTDETVVWDKENKTLSVYYNTNSGGADSKADSVRDLINNSIGHLFTASVIGDGDVVDAFATTDSAYTADGKIYDSITVNLATDANGTVTTTAAEAVNAINDSGTFQALGISASHAFSSTGSGIMETGTVTLDQLGVTATASNATGTTHATNGTTAQIKVTAATAGTAYDNVKIVFDVDNTKVAVADRDEYATYDASNKILTFVVNSASTAQNVIDNWATNAESADAAALFTADVGAVGGGAGVVTEDDYGWLRDGTTYSGTSTGSVRSQGNFDEGEVVGQGGLEFVSTGYGSKQFVSVKAMSGTFTTYDADDVAKDRDYGSDADVRVNGIGAVADGLKVSLNTSVLDLSFSILSTVTDGASMSFKITSGGAQFQLGPDVVSNQQARLGIQSVSSVKLGGDNGRMYQLRSGGAYSLQNNVKMAAAVVEDAITQVVTMRGRLGAFQRTTLDTNINSLNDTLEALTEAESSIRDADFAAESAKLTRAQILVQSGLSVLSTANSNPQNVLSLLR